MKMSASDMACIRRMGTAGPYELRVKRNPTMSRASTKRITDAGMVTASKT